MQQLRYEITGALPSTNIPVDSEAAPGFIAQLDYAFPMPSVPQMTAFWESSGSASCNIWDGADVKSELDAFDSAIIANNYCCNYALISNALFIVYFMNSAFSITRWDLI